MGRMRIAYVAASKVPSRTANSIQVMNMCHAFATAGHEVSLLVPEVGRKDQSSSEIFAFYGVQGSFSVERLPWIALRGRNHLFGWLAARKSRQLGVDLVYGRHLPGCYFAARSNLPVVFEAHYPIADGSGAMAERYFTALTSRSNFVRLVVISDALRNEYERCYPGVRGKIIVAPDGAGAPSRDAPSAWQNADGRLQVGYIGQLYPGKGIEILSQLPERCEWAFFHIIGGTESDVEQWSRRLSHLPNVKVHGFIPPGELDPRRSAFDVMLAPYQTRVASSGELDIAAWMSPLKVFEYMASGKAIIASDLPVLREVLNESNALLVDPGDVNAWSEAIDRLRDEPLRRALGDAAREDFESKYEWSRRVERILAECHLPLKRDVHEP
jgi:glycosyltransferase involved in cell wall biosynthesis